MKVAIPYKDGEIFEHFGHAETFAIYEYEDTVESCVKKLIDCTGLHGHKDMADLMKANEVDAVLCGNLGDEARSLLLSYGIVPVAGYCGDADTASDMLVTGQLPVVEGAGACGGGCGGCGGGCCHGEDEDDGECGCGGGCCH